MSLIHVTRNPTRRTVGSFPWEEGLLKQSGSGRHRPEQEQLRAVQLYREGYGQQEVREIMRSVPPSTLNRWIALGKEADPTLEIAHVQGAQGRTVGMPMPAWEPVGKRITLFSQDAMTGEVRRAPGMFAAAGEVAEWENQLFGQMLEAGAYVAPRYNLPLLMKLHCLDGLGFSRTAKAYENFTRRKISRSTVRLLLKDMTVGAADLKSKLRMEMSLLRSAEDEESIRKRMAELANTARAKNPHHPIQRIWLTIRD